MRYNIDIMQRENQDMATNNFFLWRFIEQKIPALLFLLLAAGGMMATYFFFTPAANGQASAVVLPDRQVILSGPIFKLLPARAVIQRFAQSLPPTRIAIISGHMNNDAGAVCDDGLTEAQVNLDIALRVAEQLRERGVRVLIFAEFDPRLTNFSGDALISIHADSCNYVNDLATGFKISPSPISDSETLYNCVESEYEAATGMTFHANTITPDMADYHAFRELAVGTPAIIIETGFMNLDREMLTVNAEKPATGIANGILCFLGER